MISTTLLLLVTSTSYIGIVKHVFKTSRNVNQMMANPDGARDSSKDLSVKVMLMIGSQLTCWTTVMILTIVYSRTLVAPQLLYELTAVVIFPLNSYLNPVFNSFLYKKIVIKFKESVVKYFADKINPGHGPNINNVPRLDPDNCKI